MRRVLDRLRRRLRELGVRRVWRGSRGIGYLSQI